MPAAQIYYILYQMSSLVLSLSFGLYTTVSSPIVAVLPPPLAPLSMPFGLPRGLPPSLPLPLSGFLVAAFSLVSGPGIGGGVVRGAALPIGRTTGPFPCLSLYIYLGSTLAWRLLRLSPLSASVVITRALVNLLLSFVTALGPLDTAWRYSWCKCSAISLLV